MSFLSDGVTSVYSYADSPSDTAKYPSAWVVTNLGRGANRIMQELARTHHLKFYQEVSLNLVADQQVYYLPGNFLKYINWFNKDTVGNITGFIPLTNELEKGGAVLLDNKRIRVHPAPSASATCSLRYQHKGLTNLCEGVGTADVTAGTFVPSATPTYGSLDVTTNYYVGSYIRLWTTSAKQDLCVSSQSGTTFTLEGTIEDALDSGSGGDDISYCIIPDIPDDCWDVVYWWVVRQMKGIGEDVVSLNMVTQMYKEARHSLLQQFMSQSGRQGDRILTPWPADVDVDDPW